MHKGLLNKKILGPFRHVRPSGLDFQARARPARYHLYLQLSLYSIKFRQNFHFLLDNQLKHAIQEFFIAGKIILYDLNVSAIFVIN